MAGQLAVVADPVDGGDRALGVVLGGGGELAGVLREGDLEEIDAVAEMDEVGADLLWCALVRFGIELEQGLGDPEHGVDSSAGWQIAPLPP